MRIPFFDALGDLLKTGSTGTNVNDLVFFIAFNRLLSNALFVMDYICRLCAPIGTFGYDQRYEMSRLFCQGRQSAI